MVCTACDEPIDEGERFYDFGGEQYHMDDDCVDVYLARYQDVATLE